uniref:Ubiquitin-like protease family profile domain-containing protein n=1 Tax=Anopheles culicifacies TaxID=139723 RepID=A0A182LXK2_9DIPT
MEDLEESIKVAVLPRRGTEENTAGGTPVNTVLPVSGSVATGSVYAVQAQQSTPVVSSSLQPQQQRNPASQSFTDDANNLIQIGNGLTMTPAEFRTFQEKQQQRQQEAFRGGFNQSVRARMPQRNMTFRNRAPAGRHMVTIQTPSNQQATTTPQITLPQGPITISASQVLQQQRFLQPVTQIQLQQITPTTTLKQVQTIGPQTGDTEFRESARMLVILQSGEQRLITFTLPKESCTVQDLLEQVQVQYSPDSNIQCISNPGGDTQTPDANPEVKQKLIKGFLAVCESCGYTGMDHAKCQRCKRVFTEPPRRIPEPEKTQTPLSSGNHPPPLAPNATSTPMGGSLRKYDIYAKKQGMNAILLRAGRGGSVRSGRGRGRGAVATKYQDVEPPVFTLSSDDEDSNMTNDRSKTLYKSAIGNTSKANASQPQIKRDPLPCEPVNNEVDTSVVSNDKLRLDITDVKNLPDGQITQVDCITIRLGTLKYEANEKVTISSKGIRIVAPNVKRPTEFVSLDLQMHEMKKVLTHFSKALNVIFLYTNNSGAPCFRPELVSNDPTKRITLLMENISEEAKSIIRNIFHPNLLEEISIRDAKELLLRCSPSRALNTSNPNVSADTNGSGSNDMIDAMEIRKILIYPPGKGGISINTEDYMCLAKDQYLNDIIIDFYLNYLKLEMLEEEERQSVHIFSTFFYNRLTTLSARQRAPPGEGKDVKLTAAQKRHARVANWTKKDNIFDKKYIVIPINEQSHWFLAIICFPGLDCPVTMSNDTPAPGISAAIKQKPKTSSRPKRNLTMQIGNTTITPVSKREMESIHLTDDDMCERDEADGDESELASDAEESDDDSVDDVRQPIKQPCILIFDSLTGASRSRVVATLRDYLTCEYRAKMPDKPPKVFNKLNMPGHCVKVPQQNNYTDCGLYLLQYVEHFFLDPIVDYHLPIKQLQEWFETITVTKKREDICNLIKELIEKHDPSVLPLPSIELPTLNGKLIIDPDDSLNDAEFEEDEMDMEEEFVSAFDTTPDEEEQQQLSSSGTASATETTAETNNSSGPSLRPIGSKKTINFKRIGGQSLINRSSSNNLLDGSSNTDSPANTTTSLATSGTASGSSNASGPLSSKRPLGGNAGTKQQDCGRPKIPRINSDENPYTNASLLNVFTQRSKPTRQTYHIAFSESLFGASPVVGSSGTDSATSASCDGSRSVVAGSGSSSVSSGSTSSYCCSSAVLSPSASSSFFLCSKISRIISEKSTHFDQGLLEGPAYQHLDDGLDLDVEIEQLTVQYLGGCITTCLSWNVRW